jgi:Leucine-rich repeat (LRR) protein
MAEPDAEVIVPPQPLTKELFAKCVSEPQRTLDGAGFAFTKLDVRNQNLNSFGNALLHARFIRHLDACNNPSIAMIQAKDFVACQELVTLSLAACNITKLADLSGNRLLQHLDVSANSLVSLKSSRRFIGRMESSLADDAGDGEEKASDATNYVGAADADPDFFFSAPSLLVLLLNRNKLVSFDGLSHAAFRYALRTVWRPPM